MSLLFTCNLQPQGPSSLAAVRFSAPIRVTRIRIFPHGVSLFADAPHILSLTQPEAFYLDVYFNAHSIHPDSKDKQRAANALVPTSISYPGGLMDFTVDMGTEYATRLMIVKGSFDHLSLAIYGHLVAVEPPPVHTYEPKSTVLPDPAPLSQDLNPAQSPDPTALARSLLTVIPNAPSLTTAIQLMFCLKPTEDDWDNPDFPHLYANLDNDSEDYDLDAIISSLDRPIPENVSQETLHRFVERLNEFVGPPSVEQAYQIANVLSLSASQNPQFSQALLDSLDLATIFSATTISDAPTITCLTDASSNALIARHFYHKINLLDIINEALANITQTTTAPHTRTTTTTTTTTRTEKTLLIPLTRLKSRILGWKTFEEALSNPQAADFAQAAVLVYDISKEEQALGNWLASMMMHPDVVAMLRESEPVLQGVEVEVVPVVVMLGKEGQHVSREEFVAFVRAYLGVASLLAVLAWADSVGNDDSRERTLAIINLWQGVEGYREIVNHLFLLRQLTRRLKWITTDNDPPRHSGLLAEKTLCALTLNPYTILNEEMIETILALEQPLAYISESERLSLRKLALVADDGLPAAVEELNYESDRPFSVRRLRTVRVSVAIVQRELDEAQQGQGEEGEGENVDWKILEAFGEERSYGFIGRLVELFCDLAQDLAGHFVMGPEAKTNQPLVGQLLSTLQELLLLIERLVPLFPLGARSLRRLVVAVVDVVTCISEASTLFVSVFSAQHPQHHHQGENGKGGGGGVGGIAHTTRMVCLRVLKSFVRRDVIVEPRKIGAEVVLRTLLLCGQVGGVGSTGAGVEERKKAGERDAVAKVGQVLELIDYVLPVVDLDEEGGGDQDQGMERDVEREEREREREHWVVNVLPKIIFELRLFIRVLTVEDQVQLVGRLVRLDRGVVGVGEWLLLEEAKEMRETLKTLAGSHLVEDPLLENEEEQQQDHQIRERDAHKVEQNVQLYKLYIGLQFFWLLTTPNANTSRWFFTTISQTSSLSSLIGEILLLLLDGHYTSPPLAYLTKTLAQPHHLSVFTPDAQFAILLSLLRHAQADPTSVTSADHVLETLNAVDAAADTAHGPIQMKDGVGVDALRLEIGRLCAACAEHATAMNGQVAEMVLGVLEWLCQPSPEQAAEAASSEGGGNDWKSKLRILRGISLDDFGTLCDSLASMLQPDHANSAIILEIARTTVTVDEDEDFVPIPVELPETLVVSLGSVETLVAARSGHTRDNSITSEDGKTRGGGGGGGRPSTPKGTKTPDILGTIITPPTALLRSPAATGLTKTYANNDFRQLRQVPSARLNTSRLPSTHVDDFESGGAAPVGGPGNPLTTASVSPLIVPVPIPITDVSAFGGLLNMG